MCGARCRWLVFEYKFGFHNEKQKVCGIGCFRIRRLTPELLSSKGVRMLILSSAAP